jgi:hypothetical protein
MVFPDQDLEVDNLINKLFEYYLPLSNLDLIQLTIFNIGDIFDFWTNRPRTFIHNLYTFQSLKYLKQS